MKVVLSYKKNAVLKNSYKLTNILNNLGSIPGVLSVYPGSDKENFTLFKALADEHVAKIGYIQKAQAYFI